MAFVPGTTSDIFISYAHLDNEPFDGAELGWVTAFMTNLRKRLCQKLGSAEVAVWMDHQDLVGNRPLTGQIVEGLRKTAIFLVIVSPGYLASEWCRKERATFLELVKERTSADSRVFLVELDKVERHLFPPEFSELIPYPFWVPEPDGTPRPLGWPAVTAVEKDYYSQLNRLCGDIAGELSRLHEQTVTPSLAPMPAHENARATVFLADATDDLNMRREEVRDYLRVQGFRVLPETWQRYGDLDAFRTAVRAQLAESSLFVQLLGPRAGEGVFGTPESVPRLQLDIARETGIVIMQWRDPALELAAVDEEQRRLLEAPTVWESGLEAFKQAVEKAAVPKPPPAPPPPGRVVYVHADQPDMARAEALVASSEWDPEVGYVMSVAADDPGVVRQFLEANMEHCDAALLVYGNTGPEAVVGQVMQCRRAIGNRELPPPVLAIYDGPPPPAAKPPLKLKVPRLDVRTLNCRTDSRELWDFIRSLRS